MMKCHTCKDRWDTLHEFFFYPLRCELRTCFVCKEYTLCDYCNDQLGWFVEHEFGDMVGYRCKHGCKYAYHRRYPMDHRRYPMGHPDKKLLYKKIYVLVSGFILTK